MGIRKTIAILAVCISAMACACGDAEGNQSDGELSLFNGLSFSMRPGERPCEDLAAGQEAFHALFEDKSDLRIPLFRCIEGDGYTLYLGLPYRTTLQDLIQLNIFDNPPTAAESDVEAFLYRRHQTDSMVYAEYGRQFDRNLIYLLVAASDTAAVESLLSRDSFTKRFNQN